VVHATRVAALAHNGVAVNVLIKRVHLVLGVVEVVENDPDQAAGNEGSNGETAEHPHDRRVVQQRVERLGDGGTECVGEQEHGLNKRLHAGRCLGVGVLETGDGSEDLRDTDEHVSTGLSRNVDVVALALAVGVGAGCAERLAVAGSGLVDVVLDDGSVDHGQGTDPESNHDTVNRREVDLSLAQRGEDKLVNDRQEDDDGNGVEVLHQIVGNAVTSHLTGLSDEVVGEVAVHNPVDGVETEDLASDEGALDLIDEAVVPQLGGLLAESNLVRGLCAIHLAVSDHLANNAESVGDDRALRGSHNVNLPAKNQDECANEENAETHQVCGPEANVALHVGGGEQGQGTDVDAPVEDHVDALNGDGRVDNDALASLLVNTNGHLPPSVLVGNKGSDVGLDTTRSETDDNDGGDEASKTRAGGKRRRKRRACQDEQTDDVDSAEDENRVVLAEILVGDDGTQDGGDVTPELEESGKTSGSLVAQAEGTHSLAAIERALDVVLEDTGGTVVGESLAKLDNGDQEGRLGEGLADLAQGPELLLGGLDSTEAVILLISSADRSAGADGQWLLSEVLLGDVGTDIVALERQTVEVGVLLGLLVLVLRLLGTGGQSVCGGLSQEANELLTASLVRKPWL
jgi:hypothetical protein